MRQLGANPGAARPEYERPHGATPAHDVNVTHARWQPEPARGFSVYREGRVVEAKRAGQREAPAGGVAGAEKVC